MQGGNDDEHAAHARLHGELFPRAATTAGGGVAFHDLLDLEETLYGLGRHVRGLCCWGVSLWLDTAVRNRFGARKLKIL
jgi:hypothetical protein